MSNPDQFHVDLDQLESLSVPALIMRHNRLLSALRTVWASRRRMQDQLPLAGEVLVEGSWFPREELPQILGNFMRASHQNAQDAKNMCIQLVAARARIAELEPERDACRRAAQSWLSVVERQCRDVLDATGMHDIIDESGDGDWALVWERIATMGADLRTAQARVAELEAFVADISCHGLRADLSPTMDHSTPEKYADGMLRYLRSVDASLRAAARRFVPDADRPHNAGRPIPAPRVEVVAEAGTELGVLLAQQGIDRKDGAQ